MPRLVRECNSAMLTTLPCSTMPPRCRLPLEPGIAAQIFWDPSGPTVTCARHGLRLAREGTAKGQEAGRRRCRTKLAVLLLTLWKSREPYEFFHTVV